MIFVFDFARVLFDWQPTALVRRMMADLAPDDDSAAAIAGDIFQGYAGDWGDFDRGTVDAPELVWRIAMRTGLPRPAVQALVDSIPDALVPKPDTVALVERLRRPAVPMFFLSNMPGPYADELDRRHAFVRAFDDGVYSARVGLVKPEPAIFALAAQRFRTAPAELVFLDDHWVNVEAAQAAGWNALHFTDAAAAELLIREAGWWPA